MIITTAMGRVVEVNDDYTVAQPWASYTALEHARWDRLVRRQSKLLKNRVCPEYLEGLDTLRLSRGGIPNFERLSERLDKCTGWTIAPVPDLVPEEVFFAHLARRSFPTACFIRDEAHLDYIEEPDVFHDVFGHVPLLAQPVFADFMQMLGQAGVDARNEGRLEQQARLYWFSVEFGLIKTADGMLIYGSGIVSSKGESVFSLDNPSPNRLGFDISRVMRTEYRIDDFQETYFVIQSYDELFEALIGDLSALYGKAAAAGNLSAAEVVSGERIYHRGTGDYAREKKKIVD